MLGFNIKHYESCIGLSLPSIGRWKIEFWWAPPGYSIKPHTHDNEDIELFFLFGHNCRFHRLEKGHLLGESFLARFKHFGKHFSIRAGTIHSFDVSNWPLLFMNIEKWHTKPTSASEDIHYI